MFICTCRVPNSCPKLTDTPPFILLLFVISYSQATYRDIGRTRYPQTVRYIIHTPSACEAVLYNYLLPLPTPAIFFQHHPLIHSSLHSSWLLECCRQYPSRDRLRTSQS
ncbi:hypothetical protein F4815DRAFT_360759 [Daldinia loculata]|nr:hypothetical protein F4815DRAFT_360759 [Daldinia loculata]